MKQDFAHLHVHTEYSILDGASKIDELVKKASEDGMSSLGITDHGNMFGVPSFYKACLKYGVKPVIGVELYQAKECVDERPSRKNKQEDDSGGETQSGDKMYYHATTIAETQEGYRNLCKLSSETYEKGYYYKPRFDWDMLERHSSGLIMTSGCLGGLVNQQLLKGDMQEATRIASRFQDILGKDNFFIEIQDHGIPAQHQTNPELIELSNKIDAPLVVTNDSHYTHEHDHVGHDALLCVNTGSLISDKDRFRFHGHEHYFKSSEEMRSIFPDYPEAADNTLLIAERCDVKLDFDTQHLPNFDIPQEFSNGEDYLRHLIHAGAVERWGDNYSKEIRERLDFEFNVINEMGFVHYFLIVWDLVKYALENNISVGPGRGSAAGCAIAYTLKITDIDPIEHDLLFERFLNPARVSMPDIDIDFDTRYREAMIDYTANKYGQEYVAQIITYGLIKAKSAIRDSARVLGFPYAHGDVLAKAMPPMIAGRDVPLWACFEQDENWMEGYANAKDLRALVDSNKDYQEIVDIALQLEGARRSTGIHAAAVVISDVPVTDVIPTIRTPDKSTKGLGPVHTQYDMKAVEDMGFLKMDFLGLKNLDIIRDTLGFIEKNHGVKMRESDIPLDDEKTYKMLSEGHGIGVFQLESPGMRSLLKRLRPTSFQDVAALVALYRPGPMGADMHLQYADRKNGLEKVTHVHPDAAEIMSETYGLMIYQELMMRIAQKFAGYSLADADILRRVCGKKQRDKIKEERSKFVQGCLNNGYSQSVADEWFDIIEPFADYAFNKSHAYGYGLISCQTAWLKANYPIEYMCALLIASEGNTDKMGVILKECKRMGIQVAVPDVKFSGPHFTPLEDKILFGLSSIKDVGINAAKEILAIRETLAPDADLFDFIEAMPKGSALNSRAYERLIQVGAFNIPRDSALEVLDSALAVKKSLDTQAKKTGMSVTLFDMEDNDLGYDKWGDFRSQLLVDSSEKQIREWEKAWLGIWVSSHPLDNMEEEIESINSISASELGSIEADSSVVICGVIEEVGERTTKKGDRMAILSVADLEGSFEMVVFPRTYRAFSHIIEENGIVVFQAKVQDRDGDKNLIVEICETYDNYENQFVDSLIHAEIPDDIPFEIHVNKATLTFTIMDKMKEILLESRGKKEVVLLFDSGEVVSLGSKFTVDENEVKESLQRLLGINAVQ